MKPEASKKPQKSRLREDIRNLRRMLGADEKQARDSAINRFLTSYLVEYRPRVTAAFWPFDGEPDLLPSLDLLQREGVQVALPVIGNISGSTSMTFRKWAPETRMENNRFGIPEPKGTPEVLVIDIDLMLLPLVAFDDTGNRLGTA